MKKLTVFLFVLMFLTELSASKPDNRFAAGIIIGEPTGISLKMWQTNTKAVDAGIAWSLGKNSHLSLHADYLFHKFIIASNEGMKIPLYYGIGARVKLQDETKLGIRFPIGIDYLFRNVPIDVFFEIVPVFDLVPETSFDFGAVIGIRYNFSIN